MPAFQLSSTPSVSSRLGLAAGGRYISITSLGTQHLQQLVAWSCGELCVRGRIIANKCL